MLHKTHKLLASVLLFAGSSFACNSTSINNKDRCLDEVNPPDTVVSIVRDTVVVQPIYDNRQLVLNWDGFAEEVNSVVNNATVAILRLSAEYRRK
jgi:hypothetical protein